MKKLVLITSMLTLFACKKEGQVSEKEIVNMTTTADSAKVPAETPLHQINLETFGYPPQVNGCSCYFAKDKADFEVEKYIYFDDYGNSAYLQIDGETIKFPMKEGDFDPENFNKKIENAEYTITIVGNKIKDLDEVMMFEGTMTVENKKGEKTVTTIYGECSC